MPYAKYHYKQKEKERYLKRKKEGYWEIRYIGSYNKKYEKGMKCPQRRVKNPNNVMKFLIKDPEFIKKKLRGLIKRPTKPEKVLFELIQQNNFPYKYVGDGKIIIKYFNPDFINCNGQKKVIEMFGDYWHGKDRRHMTQLQREERFAKYGFKMLVIWESELGNQDQLLNKVEKFMEV